MASFASQLALGIPSPPSKTANPPNIMWVLEIQTPVLRVAHRLEVEGQVGGVWRFLGFCLGASLSSWVLYPR